MKDLWQRFRAWKGLKTPRQVEVEGHLLHIPVGVLDPVLFRSGKVFAAYLRHQIQPNESLLDLGCGSGVVGVIAQHVGARVTATDVDPRACDAAQQNGIAHVLHGNLFEPIAGQKFDHIAFNPPYFRGMPTDHPLGRALYGGETLQIVQEFVNHVHLFLKPRGSAWIILSKLEPMAADLLSVQWTPVHQQIVQGEVLQIYRMQHDR